jgi:hypothetical protein
MQTGDAAESFEFDLKWSANSMYGGSIDTVSQHQLILCWHLSDDRFGTQRLSRLSPTFSLQ